MTRRLHHWACVLLCTLLTTIGLQAEVTPSITNLPSESLRTGSDGVITMTTSGAVGEQIMLAVSPVEGQNVIAEGLKEPLVLDGTEHLYTLTSQTVTLRGNLTHLACDEMKDSSIPTGHRNQLTSLDVSGCKTLTYLDCSNNLLQSLDITHNEALTELFCMDNQLTSLDLSHARALTTLVCYENKLTQLDLSPCTKLTELGVGENLLTHLDVSHNRELQFLDCYGNQIKGEAMTELVNGLPDRRGKVSGIFQVIGMDAQTDGNICLKSDVAIAKGKNWSVQSCSGDSEGEDPTYSVTLTKEGEGTLTATGADDLNAVPYGTELTVIATPAEGYELTALTANGIDILATKKIVVKGATEVKATFVDHTSVGEVGTETMRLYPNPAREYIIVEGTLPATLVTLYSMEGMRLYEDETDAEGTLRIDLSAYAEGTYLLRIADQTHRIIVQH